MTRKSVFSIAQFTPLGLASSRPTSDNRWQDEVSRFCSTGPVNQGRGWERSSKVRLVSPMLTALETQMPDLSGRDRQSRGLAHPHARLRRSATRARVARPATRAVTASLLRVSEKLVPPRPEIGKAGANVEDQDRHGILLG